MTIRTRKQQTRQATLARIRALDPALRRQQESSLGARLLDAPGFSGAQVVLMHVAAFADEVETRPWLQLVLDAGKRLVCPRIRPERRELELVEIKHLGRDLAPGFRSILEPIESCSLVAPTEVDWALVPGIAFDRRGFRLGRGGGYYDRLLPRLQPGTACWSLILEAQWVDEVPREAHDQPLSGVIDPHATHWGRRDGHFSES